jgi:hypothetical protein
MKGTQPEIIATSLAQADVLSDDIHDAYSISDPLDDIIGAAHGVGGSLQWLGVCGNAKVRSRTQDSDF